LSACLVRTSINQLPPFRRGGSSLFWAVAACDHFTLLDRRSRSVHNRSTNTCVPPLSLSVVVLQSGPAAESPNSSPPRYYFLIPFDVVGLFSKEFLPFLWLVLLFSAVFVVCSTQNVLSCFAVLQRMGRQILGSEPPTFSSLSTFPTAHPFCTSLPLVPSVRLDLAADVVSSLFSMVVGRVLRCDNTTFDLGVCELLTSCAIALLLFPPFFRAWSLSQKAVHFPPRSSSSRKPGSVP